MKGENLMFKLGQLNLDYVWLLLDLQVGRSPLVEGKNVGGEK